VSVYGTSGSNTLNSATVAANTLAPGTTYDLDIVYSNRNLTPGPEGFGNSNAFYSYDLRTDLLFTTAASVPEPSTLVLAGLGVALLLGVNVVRRWFQARTGARVSTSPAAI
jgi:PEP-CTERM motif